MGIKNLFITLSSIIIEFLLPGAPLVMLLVAAIIITSMDNKGAGILSIMDRVTTVSIYNTYTVILFLVVVNLLGLVPGFSLSISLPRVAFGGFMVFWVNDVFNSVSDLLGYIVMFVPGGAPIVLLPLLYIIEIVSYVMRPLALVIRICVNLFCRHMLLILRGIASFMVMVFVLLLEFGVAVVQGYVYSMILML